MSGKNFVLIGSAGYIAPKHLKAIKDTGNQLIASLDKNDSVGILDSFFPASAFFTEFERFDRYVEKIRRSGTKIDYVVVCSPNYLHDAHIRFGLRIGADVICEKPLVLNPWNIAGLSELEQETKKQVYAILQLRLHPGIIALKEKILNQPDKFYDLELTYITSRGSWYYTSWKGDMHKSGGIATNIGIHFFDMLIWLFGPVQQNIIYLHTHDRASGWLKFTRAQARWFLSINENTLPLQAKEQGKRTYRSLTLNGEEIEFSEGFTDLHTISYQKILQGEGFRLEETRPAIQIVHDIRRLPINPFDDKTHPLAYFPTEPHPFYS